MHYIRLQHWCVPVLSIDLTNPDLWEILDFTRWHLLHRVHEQLSSYRLVCLSPDFANAGDCSVHLRSVILSAYVQALSHEQSSGILTLQPTSLPSSKAAGLERHQLAILLLGLPVLALGTVAVMYKKYPWANGFALTWHGVSHAWTF